MEQILIWGIVYVDLFLTDPDKYLPLSPHSVCSKNHLFWLYIQ